MRIPYIQNTNQEKNYYLVNKKFKKKLETFSPEIIIGFKHF